MNFVDTTIQTDLQPVSLPAEAMTYNGVCFDVVIPGYRTLNVSGRELYTKELTEEAEITDGSRIYRSRYPARKITVKYQLIAKDSEAFRKAFNDLNRYLNTDDVTIIFNDEPDKYFKGRKTAGTEPSPGCNAITGELTLYCADPFKYSLEEKSFPAQVNSDGTLTATIENEGSYPCSIRYEAEMQDMNGYLSVVSAQGAMEYGYKDNLPYMKATSETVLNLSDFKPGTSVNKCFDYPTYYKLDKGTKMKTVKGGASRLSVSVKLTNGSGDMWTYEPFSYSDSTELASNGDIYVRHLHIPVKGDNRLFLDVEVDLKKTASGISWTVKAAQTHQIGFYGHTRSNAGTLTVSVNGKQLCSNVVSVNNNWTPKDLSHSYSGKWSGNYQDSSSVSVTLLSMDYNSASGFTGGECTAALKADSNGDKGAENFLLDFEPIFQCFNRREIGGMVVTCVDDTGYPICGIYIDRQSRSSSEARFGYRVGGQTVRIQNISIDDYGRFTVGHNYRVSLHKYDDAVTFHDLKFSTFHNPDIKGRKCTKIQIVICQNGSDVPGVDLNGVKSLRVIKYNVDKIEEVAEKFPEGSKAVIDGETGKLTLDGSFQPYEILGTEYFMAPPGELNVEFGYSYWCKKPPKITAYIRERYL